MKQVGVSNGGGGASTLDLPHTWRDLPFVIPRDLARRQAKRSLSRAEAGEVVAAAPSFKLSST